jgi:hypothetical protein
MDTPRAGLGRAGQGRAGQGRAGQGRAGQGRAGQAIVDQSAGRVQFVVSALIHHSDLPDEFAMPARDRDVDPGGVDVADVI